MKNTVKSSYKMLDSEWRACETSYDRDEFRQLLTTTCVTGNFEWRSKDYERLYQFFESTV